MAPILLIVGPPNGGKGTLCDNIVRDYGLVHLSGGDILRANIKARTQLGLEARAFMDRGALVSDKTMIQLFLSELNSEKVKQHGALLDGFPRTLAQAQALTAAGIKVDGMIVLEASDKELLQRSAGRRLDPGTGKIYHLKFKPPPASIAHRLIIRPDDTESRQKMRIGIYRESLADLTKHFHKELIPVNAEGAISGVYKEFLEAVVSRGVLPRPAKKKASKL